jgi:phospholipase C
LLSKGFLIDKGGIGTDIAGNNMNYGIWMNRNGTITGGFETLNGTDHFVLSEGKYNDGKWHQIIVTYDGKDRLVMYVDGKENGSRNTGGAIPETTNEQPIILGSNSYRHDNFFSGRIDEIRIWNRTLAFPEISEAYKNNKYNTDKQFIYLPFDEEKGTKAINETNADIKSVKLDGIYLNGSSFQIVKPNLPEYATFLKPFHLQDMTTKNPYYNSRAYKMSYNHGLMNGFLSAQLLNRGDAELVMGYYDNHDLPYYWDFASEYVLADNFFAPSMSTGLSNELYLYGGSPEDYQKNGSFGTVSSINRTIFNDLQDNGISWKIYAEDDVNTLNPTNNLPLGGARNILKMLPGFLENETLMSNIAGLSEYFRDLSTYNFPSVAYIVAPSMSETAPKDPSVGQEFVAALVLALMKSKHWNDSVFIVTYRESGGWYDHVPPPTRGGELYGFRVPTLIISPYSNKGYVDSTLYDATSILKFIEYNYGLPPPTNRDADANNILNAFNFTEPPRKPIEVQEISRERLLIRSEDVTGINSVYVFSILALLSVIILWHYHNRRMRYHLRFISMFRSFSQKISGHH